MYLRPQRFEPLGAFFVPGVQTTTENCHFLCCPTTSLMIENPKRALLVIDVQNEYFKASCPLHIHQPGCHNGSRRPYEPILENNFRGACRRYRPGNCLRPHSEAMAPAMGHDARRTGPLMAR